MTQPNADATTPVRPARVEWVAAVLLFAASVAAILGTARLAVMSPFGPGPRFFTLVVAAPMLLLTGGHLVALALRSRRGASRARPATDDAVPGRFAALAASVFVYALVLEPVGFAISTAAMSWIALTLLGRGRARAAIEAILATALIHVAFARLLGVQLPAAAWEPLARLGL